MVVTADRQRKTTIILFTESSLGKLTLKGVTEIHSRVILHTYPTLRVQFPKCAAGDEFRVNQTPWHIAGAGCFRISNPGLYSNSCILVYFALLQLIILHQLANLYLPRNTPPGNSPDSASKNCDWRRHIPPLDTRISHGRYDDPPWL